MDYGNVPGCTYCTREVASVGMTEAQAKEKGYEIKVGNFLLPHQVKLKRGVIGGVCVIFDAKYGNGLVVT